MKELALDPPLTTLATPEEVTWGINWTDRLTDEGPDVTAESAIAALTSITNPSRKVPVGAVGECTVDSPWIMVPMVGAGLIIGNRYHFVITATSSAGNVQSAELEVHVPF